MIAGRPTNLWLGLAQAIQGAVAISAVALGADPAIVAPLSGAWGVVVGAVILVVANQPPTVSPGDTVTVQTAAGQPNYTTTIATPPAHDAPPVAEGAKP